nr:MAG TPA: hypothetical protein [Caudoviricetes sp.]
MCMNLVQKPLTMNLWRKLNRIFLKFVLEKKFICIYGIVKDYHEKGIN